MDVLPIKRRERTKSKQTLKWNPVTSVAQHEGTNIRGDGTELVGRSLSEELCTRDATLTGNLLLENNFTVKMTELMVPVFSLYNSMNFPTASFEDPQR